MRSTAIRRCRLLRQVTAACASRCGSLRTSTRRFRTARRFTSISAAALVLAGCGGSKPLAYTDLTEAAGPLEFTHITVKLFDDRRDLVKVLEQNNPGRRLHLPAIDFTRKRVFLVAAGPRSSTGYDLRVVRVRDEGRRIVVAVRERTPSLGDPVEARVTYPYRLLALPRGDDSVKLKWLDRP
jgi:hypothetical protein